MTTHRNAAAAGVGTDGERTIHGTGGTSQDTALDRVLAALRRLGDVEPGSNGNYRACCPAHDDRKPSLSVLGTGGRVLLHCFAGCDSGAVVAALGLEMRDLFDNRRGVTYRYDNGRIVHRGPQKDFWQQGADNPPELFRLSTVKHAVEQGRPVYVVEGEQDVLNGESLVAGTRDAPAFTCNPMGAGNWDKIDPSPLYGAQVTVIADNDEPGMKHAAQVVASLDGKATVRVVKAASGKDLTDHILADLALADLVPVPLEALPSVDSDSGSTQIRVMRLSEAQPVKVDRLTSDAAVPLFEGMLTSLVGRGDSCKTMLAVHAALDICRAGRSVLVFDGEMNAASWRQRMAELGDDGSAAERCIYAEIDNLSIEPDAVREIVEEHDIRLVIWDSAASVTARVARSENDNAEMTRVFDAIRGIVRAGPAGLIIDHSAKNGESLTSRGASAKFNSVDLAYGVEKVTGKPNLEHEWTVRVTVEKDRHALLDGRDVREVLFRPEGNRRLALTWFTPSEITVEPDADADDPVAAIASLDPPPTSANEAVTRLRESGCKFSRKRALDAFKTWKAGQ